MKILLLSCNTGEGHNSAGKALKKYFEENALGYVKVDELKPGEKIVSEIESRLSICNKIEETINTALQEAEAMRQSILKQAFAGEL